MRILHTADWHLGHTLRDHARTAEHAHFLSWLVETIVAREVDALLIAGDVFDSANPPPSAWRLWFDFLGRLKRARPQVQVVVIAGNHDSAARLSAPRELLHAFDVRVVGRLERGHDGRLLVDDVIVPLRDASGSVCAQCVAIPFLRGSDVVGLAKSEAGMVGDLLPRPGDDDDVGDSARDPLIDGMRVLHEQLFAAARERLQPGQALLAMAHGYLVGGALSELSERKVLGGNQHALPLDLFPADCAYVALGHLHRPQVLAGREHIRYSGSPIPLSMPERLHAHHVVFCDLAFGKVEKVWSLRTPRVVDLVRIPERGALSPEAAIAAVQALPPRDAEGEADRRPFVEVAVELDQPSPRIAEQVAQAIADREARLVRVEVALRETESAAASAPRELTTLSVEEVFERRYRCDFDGEVPAPLMRAFRELVEEVEREGEGHGGAA